MAHSRAEHKLPFATQVGRRKQESACATASAQGTLCLLSLQGMLLVMSMVLSEGRVGEQGLFW